MRQKLSKILQDNGITLCPRAKWHVMSYTNDQAWLSDHGEFIRICPDKIVFWEDMRCLNFKVVIPGRISKIYGRGNWGRYKKATTRLVG